MDQAAPRTLAEDRRDADSERAKRGRVAEPVEAQFDHPFAFGSSSGSFEGFEDEYGPAGPEEAGSGGCQGRGGEAGGGKVLSENYSARPGEGMKVSL